MPNVWSWPKSYHPLAGAHPCAVVDICKNDAVVRTLNITNAIGVEHSEHVVYDDHRMVREANARPAAWKFELVDAYVGASAGRASADNHDRRGCGILRQERQRRDARRGAPIGRMHHEHVSAGDVVRYRRFQHSGSRGPRARVWSTVADDRDSNSARHREPGGPCTCPGGELNGVPVDGGCGCWGCNCLNCRC